MLQVIFIFSDWILIKRIIVFSTPFILGETDFQKHSRVYYREFRVENWGMSKNTMIQCIF